MDETPPTLVTLAQVLHPTSVHHSRLAVGLTAALFCAWIGTRIWAPEHSSELAHCMAQPAIPPQDANDLDIARFIMAENIAAADCRLVVHNYLPGDDG